MQIIDSSVDDRNLSTLSSDTLRAKLVDLGHDMGRESIGRVLARLSLLQRRLGEVEIGAFPDNLVVGHVEHANRPDLLDDVHVGNLRRRGVYIRHILELERSALEELVVQLEAVVHGDIIATKRLVEGIRILVTSIINSVA